MRRIVLLILFAGLAAASADAQTLHRIGVEWRPVYVLPTHRFLAGDNLYGTPIDRSLSVHLKYGFQSLRHTHAPTAYQGIGLSHHRFFYTRRPTVPAGLDLHTRELGAPTAFYLFQGAQIAHLSPGFSLNYEWNLGLSFGWTPYRSPENEYNKVIGSKVNAYLNANFYLNYILSPAIDLTAGVSLAHFSNGSTRLPNAGLNTAGMTFGMIYNINRKNGRNHSILKKKADFQQHISYEALLFGAWRKKGVKVGDHVYGSPQTYPVAGFSFATMYNPGHKIRLGAALDGVYDGSANIYVEDRIVGLGETPSAQDFRKPSWEKQWALGLAAQVDYAMPHFTLTLGVGANVLHGGGELNSFYQKLALKIDLTPDSFLHIGYSLREFRAPNFLMLGIGMRFRP